jgi:hypothetical protein
MMTPKYWRHDTQHNNTQHNDTKLNNTKHNGIQRNDTQQTWLSAQHFTINAKCPMFNVVIMSNCHYAELR